MKSFAIKQFLNKNLYVILLKRLMLVMGIFSLSRFFFYWINRSLFINITFSDYIRMSVGGLKFDTVAVLYTNILFIFLFVIPFKIRYHVYYQLFLKYIFIITNTVAIALNCVDFIYFKFTLKRTTWSVFKEFSNENHLYKLFLRFMFDYWYVLILFFLLFLILLKCYGKQIPKPTKFINPWLYYSIGVVLMSIFSGLFVAGVRGGFRHSTRPITLSNAGDFVKNPLDLNIVLNTPFAIYKTVEITDLEKLHDFKNSQEIAAIYQPIHQPSQESMPFRDDNVVIIILESNAKEYYGFYNKGLDGGHYKGYTPFMDSLIEHSLTFRYSFANGRKSIDAMPSILCSIPSMVEPFVTTRYATNNINSLPSLLKKKGYYTTFFHGAPNGSMGFQAFANLIGYDAYLGKNEYNNNNDFDGMWGIWDEEFFQFFARKLNTFKKPFFTTIFSVSSHHPFVLPERYQNKFPKGTLPVHQCIGYTDMALRKFFKTAEKMPWFKNTLFVITADHSSESYHDVYKTSLGDFAVPIIFYKPNSNLKNYNVHRIVQQTDIMPSILGYLNYDKPYLAFGFDVLRSPTSNKNFAINYHPGGYYQIIKDDYLLQHDGNKVKGIYNFKTDTFLRNPLLNNQKRCDTLEKYLKAFRQQYNNRMIDNELLPTIDSRH